jgi:hypothetical protein
MASNRDADWYRARARQTRGRDGDIEFDEGAEVSMNDDPHGSEGAYVQAWVWVRNAEGAED